jgi:hypothetical protein
VARTGLERAELADAAGPRHRPGTYRRDRKCGLLCGEQHYRFVRLSAGRNRIQTNGPAPAKGFWALPIGDGGTKGGATYRFRSENGNACVEWLPTAFPFAEGARVRIRLPPAVSQQTFGSSQDGARAADKAAARSPASFLRGIIQCRLAGGMA